MLVLAFGSSAFPTETSTARVSVVSANAVEIEGVEVQFKGQKARLKAGYEYQRESRRTLAVLKTSNVARIQTGTLTCTRQGRGECTVDFDRETAACSYGCYFVGSRGVARAQ